MQSVHPLLVIESADRDRFYARARAAKVRREYAESPSKNAARPVADGVSRGIPRLIRTTRTGTT